MSDIAKKLASMDQIIELAMSVEKTDPIDWSSVNIEPEAAYKMMAAHVVDMFENHSDADKEITMMSVMTKLIVENFVLNLRIHENNG